MTLSEAAVSFVGTPYHDGARLPGVGLDCVGVIVCACRLAGYTVDDHVGHTRGDHLAKFEEAITRIADRETGPLQDGDVIVFRWHSIPVHCGIVVGEGRDIVHAQSLPGAAGVVRIPNFMDDRWRQRVYAVWRMRS